jgi:hypothetical protein
MILNVFIGNKEAYQLFSSKKGLGQTTPPARELVAPVKPEPKAESRQN